MKNKFMRGFTLIEAIITLAVLGAAIGPLMSMFVLSARINRESSTEFKSLLTAQRYVEEIKAEEEIDTANYIYNPGTGSYERNVAQTEDEYGAVIRITPERPFLYTVEVFVIDEGETINSIRGSKIVE